MLQCLEMGLEIIFDENKENYAQNLAIYPNNAAYCTKPLAEGQERQNVKKRNNKHKQVLKMVAMQEPAHKKVAFEDCVSVRYFHFHDA